MLCADHELNVSTFTARCAASASASPYEVVSAAMATLKGAKHGGVTERVLMLFSEAGSRPRRAVMVLANRLRRGEHIPGFGHPLYPAGDPRATALLRFAEASGNEPEWRLAQSLKNAGQNLLHDLPNLDFALVALARTHDLAPFRSVSAVRLGPDSRLDCACHRAICRCRSDPSTCLLHGATAGGLREGNKSAHVHH